MQFVSALDRQPKMRPVLCLFEGVATGAADGYGRIAGKPACTLLHLGPGYGNGLANLHNARRAFTPIVNVIGDHATYHRQYDAPLASDIAAIAGANSVWVKSAETPDEVSALAAEAARKLRTAAKPMLLLGTTVCGEAGLVAAGRIAATGVRVVADGFIARMPRGAGRFAPDRMQYFAEAAMADLAGVDLMVLVESRPPVAFFAYPDRPSLLVPEGCETFALASREEDGVAALTALADALGAPTSPQVQPLLLPGAAPTGALTPASAGVSIARHLPEGAIVSDDSVTSGGGAAIATRTGHPHDWLGLTGGAIGQGIPVAVGAAVAAPGRKVVSLNGDGAAMYTAQGLWTLAREQLDVTVVIFANHSYRILGIELGRTGAGNPGPAASSLLSLGEPAIDWASYAKGLGVPGVRCDTAEAFDAAFVRAMNEPGPKLIEAVIP
jgi:acetolactate synthase-1/2/3 large subunit